jgi:hypothetical protein
MLKFSFYKETTVFSISKIDINLLSAYHPLHVFCLFKWLLIPVPIVCVYYRQKFPYMS